MYHLSCLYNAPLIIVITSPLWSFAPRGLFNIVNKKKSKKNLPITFNLQLIYLLTLLKSYRNYYGIASEMDIYLGYFSR